MGEARVPVVGDVWRLSRWHYESNEVTIVSLGARGGCLCKAHVRCLMSSGNEDGWCEGTFAKVATFVRSASPPKERDWSAWLPPRPLPNTGPKVFKVGQVWATHVNYDGTDPARVWRVSSVDQKNDQWMTVDMLATNGQCGGAIVGPGARISNPEYTCRAILVADVGCEPTPPEVLYGAAPPVAPPVVEALKGPHGTLVCPCGGVDYLNAPHDEGCSLRRGQATRRDREQGLGIAPLFAPKPCPLVGCGHRRCVVPSDQPWRPSLHPDELIGRDV